MRDIVEAHYKACLCELLPTFVVFFFPLGKTAVG